MAGAGNFFSNYEPFNGSKRARWWSMWRSSIRYTAPMKQRLEVFFREPGADYVVSSAHPRQVNGAPSTNPRYLQSRPDLANPRDAYLAEMAARLAREIPAARPVYQPVNAVLAGRRNSPAIRKAARRRWRSTDRCTIRNCPSFHGFCRQLDRQIACDHGIWKRRGIDQRSVQCLVAGSGFEQRAGIGHLDVLCGIYDLGGTCGAEFSGGS